MLRFAAALMFALSFVTTAHTQEKDCEVEDFIAKQSGQFVAINGASTCESGYLAYRLYDGETFIGSGTARIRGFVFQTFEEIDMPERLTMKYVIR